MKEDSLKFRAMTIEDTDKIVKWRNREFVRKNFIYQEPFTRQEHLSWIETQVNAGRVVQFIISLPGGREIGSVYLRDIDRKEGHAEFGIFIGEPDAVNHGYGTEATNWVLSYAFEELKLQKVFLRVLSDNLRARKSYEHAGFQMIEGEEETVTLLDGKHQVIFMEMTRERFATRKQRGCV